MFENIPYQIIKSKRKTYSIEFTSVGDLKVKVPYYLGNTEINNIIKKHQGWISKKHLEISQKNSNPLIRLLRSYEKIQYKGKLIDIELSGKQKTAEIFDDKLVLPRSFENRLDSFIPSYLKKLALYNFKKRIEILNSDGSFKISSVKLSSAKKRWGSCSSKGNINLNWKLIMTPEIVCDSVILHELVHTKHMNHSAKFYKLLDSIDKNRNESDLWLKNNSFILDLYN